MNLQRSSGDLIADRRFAYAEACLSEGDAAGAAEMAEQALELAPRYAPAWALLGRARENLHAAGGGEAVFQAALRAYAAALDIDPDDTFGTRMRLLGMGRGEQAGAMSPAYVRALFDGYAERFERHLVDGLSYRGPQMLCAALDAVAGASTRFEHAIDLGCGTGLMGAALAGRVKRLTGIDLSPAMLAKAEAKRVYHRLAAGDLLDILAGEPEASADLVTAADVFIYLGDLAPVLPRVARVLLAGGLAAVTVQSHEADASGDGVRLGADARYSHADAHLEAAAAAAGLAILVLAPAAIREERGAGVPGRVAVLRREAADRFSGS